MMISIIKEKLTKHFPDVIRYNEIYINSMIEISVYSYKDMTIEEASEFQTKIMDRNPNGYGGPFKFESEKLDDNTYKITWQFYAISG